MTKRFYARNYKRLEEVEITSGAGLVVLGGKNAQGKSSFLDAIRETVRFVGKRETPEPIRQGETEAEVSITDHERDRRYVRTFKKSKTGTVSSTVGVYALDGARYENASQIIAEDIGTEIIDAAQFAMLGPRDQRETLLRQVDLPFDLDQLARKRRAYEDDRKIANAAVKRLQGALDSMVNPLPGTPYEEVSATDLIAQLSVANESNRLARLAVLDLAELRGRIDRLEAELAQAKGDLPVFEAAAKREHIDTSELEAQIEGVEETNAAVRAAAQWRAVAADLEVAQDEADAAQRDLDAVDAQKRAALSAAVFPDPLLSVDDEQVLYDGVPFTQVNSAKQIGVGFDIATLAHRDLKIGFIKNGDLLDDESLAEIEQRAIERGYTIIVERGRSGEVGYIFEEGELVS